MLHTCPMLIFLYVYKDVWHCHPFSGMVWFGKELFPVHCLCSYKWRLCWSRDTFRISCHEKHTTKCWEPFVESCHSPSWYTPFLANVGPTKSSTKFEDQSLKGIYQAFISWQKHDPNMPTHVRETPLWVLIFHGLIDCDIHPSRWVCKRLIWDIATLVSGGVWPPRQA